MRFICICASNIVRSGEQSVSKQICRKMEAFFTWQGAQAETADLRGYDLTPCIGCGKCFDKKRCCSDGAFNKIYEKLIRSDGVVFVSAHYAPVPAKLCMLLEKMEEITFLHWWRDNSYRAEIFGLPAGIISHGGGSDWALKSYKAMVNDTIANALDTIQCKVVPYNEEWDTGISLPVRKIKVGEDVFPVQEYDWDSLVPVLAGYGRLILRAAENTGR